MKNRILAIVIAAALAVSLVTIGSFGEQAAEQADFVMKTDTLTPGQARSWR